ncbi:MAG TPA: LLM class flavin-dependent oxidoreductase [Fluviicoccus sp.]|nr:LLM class flavin-dependent oxidoreductase [Fluviicoccus sp.]
MSLEFFWQLPVSGDARYGDAAKTLRGERRNLSRPPFTPGVTDPRGDTFNYLDYLHQIARAADLVGFDGLRIPHDPEGDESWIIAGYVARSTRHLTLLAEFEASRGSSVYAAKNAVSYQRYTGGRFAWEVSAGPAAGQRRQNGDFAADSDITPRIDEFLTVARGVLTTAPFTFKGRFFEVLDGGFKGPLGNRPVPRVYLSGHSEEALQLSARQADVHVLAAAPLETLQPAIATLNRLAADAGRQLAIGLRIDLLVRETTEEAREDASRYLTQTGRGSEAAPDALLWTGLTTGLTGAAATLVGSYDDVAAALAAYAAAGITSFQLSAVPHFEEAYRVGEHLLPRLRALISGASQRAA